MDPARLIPMALPLPVEWGWFYLFQVLTFIIHVLLMNVMLGGSIIALVHHLLGRSGSAPMTRTIAHTLPFTVALAVNFGVAPLLFIQVLYGQFLYTSTVLMAVFWISEVAFIILGYGCAYLYDLRYDALGALRTLVIGLVAASLLAVAFIQTNVLTLMLAPERWSAYFDNPGGTILNLNDPTVLPRFLHIVVSSVAVAGLALALWYERRSGDAQAKRWLRVGANWYAGATMLQMALGLWFLSELPAPVMDLLLGGSLPHTLIFVSGSVLGIFSISSALRHNLRHTAVLAGTTLILMLLLRDMIRDAYLAPYYHVGDRAVTGEYLPLALFILTLVVGAGVFTWILRAAMETREVRS